MKNSWRKCFRRYSSLLIDGISIYRGQAGPIKEVRLVRNRDGRSKGFAYIEYVDEVGGDTSYPWR
jgi:hypothetical protein